MAPEPLTCQELVELVTEYLEAALPSPERARFEAHLAGCPGCAAYLDQIRQTAALLGRLEPEPIPADTLGPLLEAFRGWRR